MNDSNKAFRIKMNDFDFSFTAEEIESLDIIKKNETSFHIIRDHRSTIAVVSAEEGKSKNLTVEVAGESFDVRIEDELDQMLEQMGFGMTSAKQVKEIKAPMPGLVLEISVQEGQEVSEGNRLLILEAMKMENSIMIGRDATVKKVNVKPGQAVEKGQVLVELE